MLSVSLLFRLFAVSSTNWALLFMSLFICSADLSYSTNNSTSSLSDEDEDELEGGRKVIFFSFSGFNPFGLSS